jgi:hypothetical protein
MVTGMRALALIGLAALLSGCVFQVGDRAPKRTHASATERHEHNRVVIGRLQLGMPVDGVVAQLGDADFTEAFVRAGAPHRVLYYRTHRASGDKVSTRPGTTPLVFVDGELAGWGELTLRQVLR